MTRKSTSRRARRDEATVNLRQAAEKVREAIELLDNAKSELESLQEEMRSWHDNMNEGLQATEQGQRVEQAADALENLDLDIDLDEIASNLESAADEADEVDFPGMYGR